MMAFLDFIQRGARPQSQTRPPWWERTFRL
jgi:hypothetical protein